MILIVYLAFRNPLRPNLIIMKKVIAIYSVLYGIFILGCSKSAAPIAQQDETISIPTSTETKPEYNQTNFGVFKGVIVGSTGIIRFYINNGNNDVKCYITIDNIKDTLTTTAKFTLSEPIVKAHFVGKFSSVTLSCDERGNTVDISDLKINGHSNLQAYVVHENTSSQVFCYEGNLNGSASGSFNCIVFGSNNQDTIFALSKLKNDTIYNGSGIRLRDGSNDTAYVDILNPNWQLTNNYQLYRTKCIITTDSIKGTWSGLLGSGTIVGVRTY